MRIIVFQPHHNTGDNGSIPIVTVNRENF